MALAMDCKIRRVSAGLLAALTGCAPLFSGPSERLPAHATAVIEIDAPETQRRAQAV